MTKAIKARVGHIIITLTQTDNKIRSDVRDDRLVRSVWAAKNSSGRTIGTLVTPTGQDSGRYVDPMTDDLDDWRIAIGDIPEPTNHYMVDVHKNELRLTPAQIRFDPDEDEFTIGASMVAITDRGAVNDRIVTSLKEDFFGRKEILTTAPGRNFVYNYTIRKSGHAPMAELNTTLVERLFRPDHPLALRRSHQRLEWQKVVPTSYYGHGEGEAALCLEWY